MIFPKGVVYDAANRRFVTSEISAIYRLVDNKNDLERSSKLNMVAGAGLEPATLWL